MLRWSFSVSDSAAYQAYKKSCGRSSCEADCEFLSPETDGPDQAEERDGVVENSGSKIMNIQIKMTQLHTAG